MGSALKWASAPSLLNIPTARGLIVSKRIDMSISIASSMGSDSNSFLAMFRLVFSRLTPRERTIVFRRIDSMTHGTTAYLSDASLLKRIYQRLSPRSKSSFVHSVAMLSRANGPPAGFYVRAIKDCRSTHDLIAVAQAVQMYCVFGGHFSPFVGLARKLIKSDNLYLRISGLRLTGCRNTCSVATLDIVAASIKSKSFIVHDNASRCVLQWLERFPDLSSIIRRRISSREFIQTILDIHSRTRDKYFKYVLHNCIALYRKHGLLPRGNFPKRS